MWLGGLVGSPSELREFRYSVYENLVSTQIVENHADTYIQRLVYPRDNAMKDYSVIVVAGDSIFSTV